MDEGRLARAMLDGFARNDLLTYASAIAFQILTAIVPFLLFLLGVLSFLELSEVWREDLAPDVQERLSNAAFTLLDDTVNRVLRERAVFWITAGFALALWQSSGAVRAVMGALDKIYGNRRQRPARERYPLSLALALAVGLCLVAAFAVVRFLPLVLGDDPPLLIAIALFILRWGVAAALMALAVGLLAHFAPSRQRPLPWASFSTLLVIAGWLVMSLGFGVYLTQVADYGSIFGHLATVIVLMAYLYASAVVFLAAFQLDAIVSVEARRT